MVDLLTVDLSEAEAKLLSKGLSFCPTQQKIDGRESSNYVSDPNPLKKKNSLAPNKDRDLGLELFIQLLKSDILNTKPSKIADNLSKHEREALQKLIAHTDIVIKPAHKGKAVVQLIKEKL